MHLFAVSEGLYVLTGLGSRGIISAPLAAEYLASLINGEPLPIPRQVTDALNPVRFLVQQLKQSVQVKE